MDDLGRRAQGSAGRHLGRRVGIIASLLAVGLAVGVAPVIGEGTSQQARPNEPAVLGTVPATKVQVAGAKLSGAATSPRRKARNRIVVESRITDSAKPIETIAGQGSFVGIRCPAGSIAVSGGFVTSYIDLLMASSAPNNPLSGRYTPRVWWITVTNADLEGGNDTLSWRGIVNCMSPLKLKR